MYFFLYGDFKSNKKPSFPLNADLLHHDAAASVKIPLCVSSLGVHHLPHPCGPAPPSCPPPPPPRASEPGSPLRSNCVGHDESRGDGRVSRLCSCTIRRRAGERPAGRVFVYQRHGRLWWRDTGVHAQCVQDMKLNVPQRPERFLGATDAGADAAGDADAAADVVFLLKLRTAHPVCLAPAHEPSAGCCVTTTPFVFLSWRRSRNVPCRHAQIARVSARGCVVTGFLAMQFDLAAFLLVRKPRALDTREACASASLHETNTGHAFKHEVSNPCRRLSPVTLFVTFWGHVTPEGKLNLNKTIILKVNEKNQISKAYI